MHSYGITRDYTIKRFTVPEINGEVVTPVANENIYGSFHPEKPKSEKNFVKVLGNTMLITTIIYADGYVCISRIYRSKLRQNGLKIFLNLLNKASMWMK